MLLTGVYQIFNYWLNKRKEYKIISINRVLRSSITATSNLSFGFKGFGASGLIFSNILGQGIATMILVNNSIQKIYQYKKYITKIQEINKSSKNEEKLGKIIQQIKNYEYYFRIQISSCKINLASMDKTNLDDCKLISNSSNNDFMLMKMNYLESNAFYDFLTDKQKTKKSNKHAITANTGK